jgi:hypothetical protein
LHYNQHLGGYLIGDLAKQEGTTTLPSIYWRLEEEFFNQLARFVISGKVIQHEAIMNTTRDATAAFAATRFLAGSKVK